MFKSEIENQVENMIPNNVQIILNVLRNKGFKAYVVGGALRDISFNIIHRENLVIHDWDIATTASYDDIETLFSKLLRVNEKGRIVTKKGRVVKVIERTGTAHVYLNELKYEVTPLKMLFEGEMVVAEKIEDDLASRDFNVNSMAYGENGLIYKYVDYKGNSRNVLRDIEERVLASTVEIVASNIFHIVRGLYIANKANMFIEERTWIRMKELAYLTGNLNKGKMNVAFESFLKTGRFEKLSYLFDSGVIEANCDLWKQEYKDDLKLAFNKSIHTPNLNEKLACLFDSNIPEEVIINFLEGFGVNKTKVKNF